jgi:prevent-host-death family protein
MKATARDLRYETRRLLEAVGRGESVLITHRGKPRARLVPLEDMDSRLEPDEDLFGLWADREDTADPAAYVERLRRERS